MTHDTSPEPGGGNATYAPIAVGFALLAVPLVIAVFLAGSPAGAWTNGIAAAVMLAFAAALAPRRRR